jgi:peptide/nickel transport system substrate-binding protein
MEGPICTGPYAVESFSPTDSCVVVKNENYWDGEVPLDRVTLKCVDDQTTRSMALQTGEIDIAYNLKTENLVEFEGRQLRDSGTSVPAFYICIYEPERRPCT